MKHERSTLASLGKPRHFTWLGAALAVVLLCCTGTPAHAWWKEEWTVRKKLTVDGASVTEPVGAGVVLVRLHQGNFSFESAREDGADLRFVAEDDKTPLPYHIEKFDALLNEAFVWVKLPEIKPAASTTFWMYSGNAAENVARADDSKATFDAETVLVYHFGEKGAPVDSTANGNTAQDAGRTTEGALIGSGLRLDAKLGPKLPESDSLAWSAGGALTLSFWAKPTTLQPDAVLFSRGEAETKFVVGIDSGKLFLDLAGQKIAADTAVEAGGWHHFAVTLGAGQVVLYVDGQKAGAGAGALPAVRTAIALGAADNGFTGELDELVISKIVRPAGWVKFAAVVQGPTDKAGKLLVMAEDETSGHGGEGELAKHLALIKDISKSLTFDGWAVIFFCTVLAVVGWGVTGFKIVYLTRIDKANTAFLAAWEEVGADLKVLDHCDEKSIRTMGGKASAAVQRILKDSPLYHLYALGFAEVRHRYELAGDNFAGLSGRAMQVIKVTLDGGLTREVQSLNSKLVFLTIGIAGGPYLGLLGTVIGVMITFAVIAKSGEVEVNSIAPGIAGALLATVAGLAVAIPALFAYSYISSRIKDAVTGMQVFIDEFIARIAEAYPTANE